MERREYETMAAVEQTHWWFVARRAIIGAVLKRFVPQHKTPLDILEVGCGSGGNLSMLSAYGTVYGAEYDATAREKAVERGVAKEVAACELPSKPAFAGQTFDLILMLDVLEHIKDDQVTLDVLARQLKEDGMLLMTVPAFQWLWSQHDVQCHHQRRYTAPQLRDLIHKAGLQQRYVSYFNFWLFPLVALMRLAQRWGVGHSKATSDLKTPNMLVNAVLKGIFGSERMLVPRFRMPWGVSVMALATR